MYLELESCKRTNIAIVIHWTFFTLKIFFDISKGRITSNIVLTRQYRAVCMVQLGRAGDTSPLLIRQPVAWKPAPRDAKILIIIKMVSRVLPLDVNPT